MNKFVYLANKKDLIVKEGQSFKKNEILAKNSKYFLGDKDQEISYTTGKLCKVAISSADYTYEDSSAITDKLTKDIATKITMRKAITLGVNANINYLVKKGQKIKTGDPLVIYENSFEDSSINQLLDKLDSDFSSAINNLSKNILSSKYTGRIVDVVLTYNRNIEEFSPSIQKIINDYIKESSTKNNIIKKNVGNNIDTSINIRPTEKQNSKKIKGIDLDGLLIEIYIEYNDELSVGDKISYYTATKSVISDVIKSGQEPFSDFQKDENIDAVMSPLSIISRMSVDIYNALYLNKALIYLKRNIKNIYNK